MTPPELMMHSFALLILGSFILFINKDDNRDKEKCNFAYSLISVFSPDLLPLRIPMLSRQITNNILYLEPLLKAEIKKSPVSSMRLLEARSEGILPSGK